MKPWPRIDRRKHKEIIKRLEDEILILKEALYKERRRAMDLERSVDANRKVAREMIEDREDALRSKRNWMEIAANLARYAGDLRRQLEHTEES